MTFLVHAVGDDDDVASSQRVWGWVFFGGLLAVESILVIAICLLAAWAMRGAE